MSTNYRDRQYRSEAVVLGRTDLGEADRILIVFTPTRGRLDVIAKGARKALSRLGPTLDLFNQVQIELTHGRELEVVRSVTAIDRHPRLREDLNAYGHASYCAELVRIFTQPREAHQEIYQLLVSSFALLDDGIDPWIIARHFEMALLDALGYRPELFQCVNCSRPIQQEVNAFSASLGGLLCPECRSEDPTAIPLSVNAQKYLRLLVREGLAAVVRLAPSAKERLEIQQVTAHYVRYIAEREIQSLKVLADLQPKTLQPS